MSVRSRSSLLLMLLLALSLIAAPVGSALALAGMMDMAGKDPASVHCPESAQTADDARADPAGSDQLRSGSECCDPPCLAKCGHGTFAALATLPCMLVLPATSPPSTPVPALSVTYPEPPAHPPRSR